MPTQVSNQAPARSSPDGAEDPYETLARAIKYAGRKWFVLFGDRMGLVGQTSLRWMALSRISETAGGISQRDLSHRLVTDEPSLGRIVQALEKRGLIERTHGSDRRRKLLRLTPSAAEPLREGQRIGRELRSEITRGIPDAELAIAERVLLQICEGLDRVEKAWKSPT